MAIVPRLYKQYKSDIVPAMIKQFSLNSIMQVPRLEKVVLNCGVGEAKDNEKLLTTAVDELARITGQRPIVTRAKKSIATFKIREGMKIGCKVTLRGARMWEFLDRLINIALPRVRDFRGVSAKSFDKFGNYALGIKEQIIFPEIDYDKVERIHGLDVCIVMKQNSKKPNVELSRELLRKLGMPFKN